MSTTTNPRIAFGDMTFYSESLKYNIYKASDPTVVISTQTFAAPNTARNVTFNAMPRVNLIIKVFRVTGGGDVQVPLTFNFTPDRDDLIYYAPVEIIVDTSIGVVSGTTSFTYDGTAGTPDWRGRVAYPEREGQGTINRSKYTWDGTTGIFTITEAEVTFGAGEVFNFTFDAVVQQSGTPPVASLWTSVEVVTGTITLTAADWGKKIIIKGASPYFVVTLPAAADIPENVVTFFEFARASHTNVKLLAVGTTIDWGRDGARTYITGGLCENIAIYKEPGTGLLRVHSYEGNFLTLGRIINTDDTGPVIEMNVQALDGSILNTGTDKRLYEDYIQKLPPSEVVNYTAWASNTTKYSFANGSGDYHIPDRRNLYARNAGAAAAGTYQANMIKSTGSTLTLPLVQHTTSGTPRGVTDGPLGGSGTATVPITIGSGTETRPETFVCTMFVLK